ncbi:MAG: hypothetical protein ACR2IP_07435 [Solirubrobacteraceae bacterium]
MLTVLCTPFGSASGRTPAQAPAEQTGPDAASTPHPSGFAGGATMGALG